MLELHHRTDCKSDRIDHHYGGAWSYTTRTHAHQHTNTPPPIFGSRSGKCPRVVTRQLTIHGPCSVLCRRLQLNCCGGNGTQDYTSQGLTIPDACCVTVTAGCSNSTAPSTFNTQVRCAGGGGGGGGAPRRSTRVKGALC